MISKESNLFNFYLMIAPTCGEKYQDCCNVYGAKCMEGCTRHVDTWYYFKRERIEESTIKIELSRPYDNDFNIMKNVNQESHERYVKKFLGKEENGT
jgi:hypothetical protein